MKVREYIFKSSTNTKFNRYIGQKCIIKYIDNREICSPSSNFLDNTEAVPSHRAILVFNVGGWIRLGIMCQAPKRVNNEYHIKTINSVYTLVDTGLDVEEYSHTQNCIDDIVY